MMMMKTKMMMKKMIKKWIQRNDKEESNIFKGLEFMILILTVYSRQCIYVYKHAQCNNILL